MWVIHWTSRVEGGGWGGIKNGKREKLKYLVK